MITGKTIITPLIHSWNVTADFQKQTCKLLAKTNKVIVFLTDEGEFFLKSTRTSRIVDGIHFQKPVHLLPFKRFKLIKKINIKLALLLLLAKELLTQNLHFTKIVIWYFDPKIIYQHLYLFLIFTTVYDCVDDVSWNIHSEKNLINLLEEEVCIRKSTYFFVNSRTLYKKKLKIRKPTALVPQGFDLETFKSVPIEHTQINKKIIGYVGFINYRIDWKLVAAVALELPEYNFQFYGPLALDPGNEYIDTIQAIKILQKIPNIHFFIHSYNRFEIASIIRDFRIAIIPYELRLKANKYCFPMKFIEYLYWNKPVISTEIEELKYYKNYAYTSNSARSWIKQISNILEGHKKYFSGRNLAEKHTWKKKLEKITSFLN